MSQRVLMVAFFLLWSSLPSLVRGEAASVTVDLREGNFATGRLLSLSSDGSMALEAAGLVDPLVVPTKRARSITFPGTSGELAQGEWLAELIEGGMLRGSLIGLDAQQITMKVDEIGEVMIDRRGVVRLVRTVGETKGTVIGNGELSQWKRSKGWKEEAGYLVTTELNGTLSLSAPENPSYVLDIEVSWSAAPNFRIDACGRFQGKELTETCALETWGDKLVFLMETKGTLRMKQIDTLAASAGRGRWQVYVDLSKGRGIVSSNGKVLAELDVPPLPRQSYFGMEVRNLGTGLVLERWSMVAWDGKSPLANESPKAIVTLEDEKVIEARVESWDPSANVFRLPEGTTPATVRADIVREIRFDTNLGAEPSPHFVLGKNGYRLAGKIEGMEGDQVRWKLAGGDQAVSIPLTSIGSIQWSAPQTNEPDRPKANTRIGYLTSKELNLAGYLEEGEGVGWHSLALSGVVRPRLDQQARINYRTETPPTEPAKRMPPPAVQVAPQGNAIAQIFRRQPRNRPGQELAAGTAWDHLIHLRTGDQVPGVVRLLDEKGIHFESKMTSSTFLKHEEIQVVEFDPKANPVPILAMKKQRLLTIPRVARDNPPTHLIRLKSGDYLRCRLLGMDAESFEVEVRLERRKVPRSSVARVIWLRSEEEAGAMAGIWEGRVQTVSMAGDRLTFKPLRVESGALIGESLALASCQSPIDGMAEIVLGPAINEATKDLAFQSWRLRPAIEPLPDPGDGEGGSTGKESALVGKQAPDFELELLAGGKFKLSEHREETVVLDFWASWCGPCMQSMPSVNEVLKEFEGKKVTLVAINLEESKEEAAAAMTRLGLTLPVALDLDAAVAGLYEVKGIPQTVVVRKGGEISRLFVGGGIEEELRSALREVTEAPVPAENAKP